MSFGEGAGSPMLLNAYVGAQQDERVIKIVEESLMEFSQLQIMRNVFASQWEEIAELIFPTSRNTFNYGSYNFPGQKKTDRQIDATGMVALDRFAAICDSLLTPRNMTWHGLGTTDPYLNKQRAVRLYYQEVTRRLFQWRYNPHGNFSGQNLVSYQQLGAFGTSGMFVDGYEDPFGRPGSGLRYKSIPLGELFLRENHQGMVHGFVRWLRFTADQAAAKWGIDKLPPALRSSLEKKSQMPFDFIHRVVPRTDYQPYRLDSKGMPWASYHVCIQGRQLMSEGGFRSFPVAVGRYVQTPGEVYGRSPAMAVLPSLKTLNAQKKTFLKSGHRAADPVLLTTDDGLTDFSMRPGAMNKGGMSSDGHPLVGVLPTGNIQISKEMMQEERSLINDVFLVTLFQILTETPQMTATEVIERVNEKGILLAPTVGRQQSEYLGPLIEREIDILSFQGELPPMPGELKEAKGAYQVVYTSPLSRAMRAQEAAGFMRTVESVKEIVAITQDPSLLDSFEFDTAIPAIAEIQAVPESWMASPDSIKKKRDARAKANAQQQQIQALPAQAAMLKAQAVVSKAGGGEQGVQPSGPMSQGG